MDTKTFLTARYAETDQMGIIHHSNYPIWFEAGRTDFLKKAGMSNSQIEAAGILLPLTRMECCFKSPARYEDEIIVRTKIKKMSCVRIEFEYEVNSSDEKLIATGGTSHAWTDRNLKPLNIEKRMSELYKFLIEALKI